MTQMIKMMMKYRREETSTPDEHIFDITNLFK